MQKPSADGQGVHFVQNFSHSKRTKKDITRGLELQAEESRLFRKQEEAMESLGARAGIIKAALSRIQAELRQGRIETVKLPGSTLHWQHLHTSGKSSLNRPG